MKSDPSRQSQIVGEWIGNYQGHFEEVGFLQPRFIPGHLEILSSDRIVFHWKELGQVEYRKDD